MINIGSIVCEKKLYFSLMTVERIINNKIKCVWFDDNSHYNSDFFNEYEIVLIDDYKKWKEKELRVRKIKNILN